MVKPFVFRPFDGHARSVAIGHRIYLEGDLILASAEDVARLQAGYGGPGAFDPLTPRQVEALSKAAGYDGNSSDLIPYLMGLPQVALNEARDQVRGIGDEPAPLAAPAASAAPIPEGGQQAPVSPRRVSKKKVK